jgi:hypothetical protein
VRNQIGAWGQTIFAICSHGGQSDLELMQRQGKVRLGLAELCAIAAFVEALGFDYREYVPVMKRRLENDRG